MLRRSSHAVVEPVQPNSAQPELDLASTRTNWTWLTNADAAAINAQRAQGFRLFRLNATKYPDSRVRDVVVSGELHLVDHENSPLPNETVTVTFSQAFRLEPGVPAVTYDPAVQICAGDEVTAKAPIRVALADDRGELDLRIDLELYEQTDCSYSDLEGSTLFLGRVAVGTFLTPYLEVLDHNDLGALTNQAYLRNVRVENNNPTINPTYTALFVENTGLFARPATDWLDNLTRAEVEAIANDDTRRIIDLSSYVTNVAGEARYAVVWADDTDNTGPLARHSRVIVGAPTLAELQDEAPQFRVTSIDSVQTLAGRSYSAVMIDASGRDAREQVIGQTAAPDIYARILESATPVGGLFPSKLVALEPLEDPVTGLVDQFLFVADERFSVEEPLQRQWSAVNLSYSGSNDFAAGANVPGREPVANETALEQVDNVGVLFQRFEGRYTELKAYAKYDAITKRKETRFVAIGTSNGPYPETPAPVRNLLVDEIDAAVQEKMKEYGMPGCSLAITQGDALRYAKAYGYSHLSHTSTTNPDPTFREPRAATLDTLFRIASVSKSLTAIAILRLIECGALCGTLPGTTLPLAINTRPFGEIFPAPAATGDPALAAVTIGDILQHRTSFWPTLEDLFLNYPDPTERFRAFTELPPPALGPSDDCAGGGAACYQNLNYQLLTLIIEAISGLTYTDYIQRNFIDPLGLTELRIMRPRAGSFFDAVPEAAEYGLVTWGRRLWDVPQNRWNTLSELETVDAFLPFSGDWVLAPAVRFGASSWAASPSALLRLMQSVDGTVPGVRVLNNFAAITTNVTGGAVPGNYVYGFAIENRSGAITLEHGGYLPGSTQFYLGLRDDPPVGVVGPEDIKLAIGFNGDVVEGPSERRRVDGDLFKVVPKTSRAISELVVDIHDLLSRFPLPSQDMSGTATGVDCTGKSEWHTGTYAGGALVQNVDVLYRCKPWPQSGWCGQVGYEPGRDLNWQDAWVRVDKCVKGGTGASCRTADCATLPSWSVKAYKGGNIVQRGGFVYECKGWPYSGWCGQAAYKPGTGTAWLNAWTQVRPCAPTNPEVIDVLELDANHPFER